MRQRISDNTLRDILDDGYYMGVPVLKLAQDLQVARKRIDELEKQQEAHLAEIRANEQIIMRLGQ